MADYALGDRGSVDIITDDYYEAETLQVFEELQIDRERIWYGPAHLVPEPDNPYEPRSIAVYIDEFKIGRMSPEDSAAYWNAITRVVASGYVPVANLQLSATARRGENGSYIESHGKLSLSAPGSLFPLNNAPTQATLLPQGASMKVLDEKHHSEYLHSILPPSGEGRVILTLEANQAKLSDGTVVDSVDVLHDRKLVGRLSTQMSQQLAPVIRYAFAQNRLTSAWGTIRGNRLELSLTVQAVRADEIPQEWYQTLPNNVPELLPVADEYEVPNAFSPTVAEEHRDEQPAPVRKRGIIAGMFGGGDKAEKQDKQEQAEAERHDSPVAHEAEELLPSSDIPDESQRVLTLLKVVSALVLIVGIALIFFMPFLGILIAVAGAALLMVTVYYGRQLLGLDDEDYLDYEDDTDDTEHEPEAETGAFDTVEYVEGEEK